LSDRRAYRSRLAPVKIAWFLSYTGIKSDADYIYRDTARPAASWDIPASDPVTMHTLTSRLITSMNSG
jgi:hypothetical protein